MLESGKDVRLPDDRSLKNAKWSMYLFEKETAVGDQAPEAVGVLSYFEASSDDFHSNPEECHIEAGLDRDNFQTLVAALQAGRVPDWISIRAQGLTHGWEPDGSGKVWDTKNTPQAPVISVSFGMPLTSSQAHFLAEDEDEVGGSLPASSADIALLRSTILSQTTLLVNTIRNSVAVIVVVALIWFFVRS